MMSITSYEVTGLGPPGFKEKVAEALAAEDKTIVFDVIVVLDEFAKRRGTTTTIKTLCLRVEQVNTTPYFVHVTDEAGHWITIDVPDDSTSKVSFEVITDE